MILSISRRCDIPAFHMEWLKERINAGFVIVRNPFNASQSRTVSLSPGAVDGIVFWTKNPAPLLVCPDILAAYPFYIQYTLNMYPSDIEPGVPPLAQRIETARRIVDEFGEERLCPRYDPVLLSPQYDMNFHLEAFAYLTASLSGYTDQITISFLDIYRKIQKIMRERKIRTPDQSERQELMAGFSQIAASHNMKLLTCAEADTYPGTLTGQCIDARRLSRIAQKPIYVKPDRNQRPHCGCAQAVDIGEYGRCRHECVYCYARK